MALQSRERVGVAELPVRGRAGELPGLEVLPPGRLRWLDAQQHYGENVGDTDSQAIFVELKDIRPSGGADAEAPPLGPQGRG